MCLIYRTSICTSITDSIKFSDLNKLDLGSTPIHVGESEHEDEANVPRLMELFGINLMMSSDELQLPQLKDRVTSKSYRDYYLPTF